MYQVCAHNNFEGFWFHNVLHVHRIPDYIFIIFGCVDQTSDLNGENK
jgi:hypothetical protein